MKKKTVHLIARPHLLAFFALCCLLGMSCKKELKSDLIDLSKNENQLNLAAIPSYVFDWETATYMPSMSNANLVPMPWNSGSTAIDPNVVSDYKKAEGWELVWNTFGPNVLLNDPGYSYFFALYNKYRGVLRFYLWKEATPLATSYVNHGLRLYPLSANSSLLNYNVLEFADLGNNQKQFSQVLKQQLNLSGGTWLVFQYEMAYDPSLANTSFPALGLELDAKWVNVTNFTANGTLSGDIKGYIGDPNAGVFDLNTQLTSGAVTLAGASGYNTYLSVLNAATGGEITYVKAMTDALNDVVKGFFNAVLGGSENAIKPVNLTINTKLKLDGQLVSNGGIINTKLVLPGQLNSQTADGLTPYYNNVMGVVNVSNRPVLNSKKYVGDYIDWDPWDNPVYITYMEREYTLNKNSFSLIWNPAIINSSPSGATIQNIDMKIVQPFDENIWAIRPGLLVSGVAGNEAFVEHITENDIEKVGNKLTVKSAAEVSGSPLLRYRTDQSMAIPTPGIRISFDVVPNNGAPKCKIVKTFTPDLVY